MSILGKVLNRFLRWAIGDAKVCDICGLPAIAVRGKDHREWYTCCRYAWAAGKDGEKEDMEWVD